MYECCVRVYMCTKKVAISSKTGFENWFILLLLLLLLCAVDGAGQAADRVLLCERDNGRGGGDLRLPVPEIWVCTPSLCVCVCVCERDSPSPSPSSASHRDVAQRCYCGSVKCRGYLGQSKQSTPLRIAATRSMRDIGSPRGERRRHTTCMRDEDSLVSRIPED